MEPSRQIGMTLAPIPLSEYLAYFQIFNINDLEEREEIIFIVSELEAEFFEWYQKKYKVKNKRS